MATIAEKLAEIERQQAELKRQEELLLEQIASVDDDYSEDTEARNYFDYKEPVVDEDNGEPLKNSDSTALFNE